MKILQQTPATVGQMAELCGSPNGTSPNGTNPAEEMQTHFWQKSVLCGLQDLEEERKAHPSRYASIFTPSISGIFCPRCIRCLKLARFFLGDAAGEPLDVREGGFCRGCLPFQGPDPDPYVYGPSVGDPAPFELIEATPLPFILGWDDLPASYFAA
ncbi:MAG: hypothetical protein EOP09_01005 [Proteobacteria bacterium]|nr:MAG: hypothetical protein EOP09_01005 [Pseudomonadota bacterium]